MPSRILIIDDNIALTTLLGKTLYRFGYEPIVENNAIFALNTAREYRPDLILLDIMMPERDGGRVLGDLRADLSLRHIPVILLTAIAREVQSLADVGGIRSAVLAKPVQLQALVDEIERQLERMRTFQQQQGITSNRHTGKAFSRPAPKNLIAPPASTFGDAMPQRLCQSLPPRDPQSRLPIASFGLDAHCDSDPVPSAGRAFGQAPAGRGEEETIPPA